MVTENTDVTADSISHHNTSGIRSGLSTINSSKYKVVSILERPVDQQY